MLRTLLDHLPGPGATIATIATGTGGAALADAVLGASGPIAVGMGALLSAVAAGVWECIARARLERRIREAEHRATLDAA